MAIMYRSYTIYTLLLVCISGIYGYGQYRDQLPNGNNVAHPCKPNFVWRGVGHNGTRGGGSRNKFGQHFASQNYTWTRDLCLMDSDGDGDSNGMELGDPACEWSPGKDPTRVDDITHPGICTPFDSAKCQGQNDWVDCTGAVLECPAMNYTDTQSLLMKFPRTKVPSQETTYMCMIFNVPSDKDYHMVAYKPTIDNDNVMHHILMYGCEDSDDPVPTAPYECNMDAGNKCTKIVGAWSLGESGDCMDEKFGLRFGKSSYKRFALEFHWNNPKNVADWYDESGVTMYYTSNLRPNDGAVLTVGQIYLAIPPRKDSITFTATCPSTCTRDALKGSIFLTGATNHMHYLGTSQSVELLREGSRVEYITNELVFNYDDPKFKEYDPPLEIKPGDVIHTTCQYKATSSKNWVYYGDATSDEMCYAFMWFFPAGNMPHPYCENYKDLDICEGDGRPLIISGCNMSNFLSANPNPIDPVYLDIIASCTDLTECGDACTAAVTRARQHPCLNGGDVTEYVEMQLKEDKDGRDFLQVLKDCKKDDDVVSDDNGAVGIAGVSSLLCVLAVLVERYI